MSEELSAWQKYKKNIGNSRPWDLLDSENHVDKETADERFNICLSCPELIEKTKQCKQCGCFMALKTKLYNASCPLGKWGEVERKNND